jgi:hypothetical protein
MASGKVVPRRCGKWQATLDRLEWPIGMESDISTGFRSLMRLKTHWHVYNFDSIISFRIDSTFSQPWVLIQKLDEMSTLRPTLTDASECKRTLMAEDNRSKSNVSFSTDFVAPGWH